MKKQNEEAFAELLRHFKLEKYTDDTSRRWAEVAMEFIVFLEKNNKSVDDIGDLLNSEGKVVQKEAFGVKDYLYTKTEYSASYLRWLHHTLKGFYIAWEKHFPIDNKKFPKAKKEPKRMMFSTEQVLKIQEASRKMWIERDKKYPGDLYGLRDYCCTLISIDCGPRRIQICQLNVGDYNDVNGTLFIPGAKGGRNTVRVLTDTTRNVLRFYIVKRKEIETKEKAMFLTSSNKRISRSMLSSNLVKTMRKAGVYEKGHGYHSLRRAKAWRLKKAGFSEEKINDIMGWKIGSKMSHTYGALDQTEVQQEAANADDIFKRKETDT